LLKIRWQRKDFTDQQFEETLEELRQQAVWNVVPPEQPYGSLEALLAAEIGCTEHEAKQQLASQAIPIMGRRKKVLKFSTLSQKERAQKNGVSIPTQFKIDYLAGHNPDLLAAYEARTISADKAYRLATGKVPETPVAATTRAFARLTETEKIQFFRELPDSDRAMLLRELQMIETLFP